ncbi:hypothetical protein ACU6U9_11210 [Pseudomonas sp. HK3]
MTFSLRKRFFIFTAIASIIVMLVSSLILNYVYTLELKTEAQDKLRLHIFNLLSVSNFKNNEIALPVILSNPDFNRENSPLFSYVTNQENQKVWQSLSLSKEIHIEDKQSKTGKW